MPLHPSACYSLTIQPWLRFIRWMLEQSVDGGSLTNCHQHGLVFQAAFSNHTSWSQPTHRSTNGNAVYCVPGPCRYTAAHCATENWCCSQSPGSCVQLFIIVIIERGQPICTVWMKTVTAATVTLNPDREYQILTKCTHTHILPEKKNTHTQD